MLNGLEKRKFQRLECPLEVTVEILTDEEVPGVLPPLHVKSHNISKAGICLETKVLEVYGINLLSGSPCARKNRLHMKIELIPEEPPFHATGEVRWYDVAYDKTESMYLMGVEFLDVKGIEKDQLVRFLKKHKNNEGFFRKLFR